jgi:hypothetical protein
LVAAAGVVLTPANYEQESARREVNALQKEIGAIKKAKGDASELLAKKGELDKKIAELTARAAELVRKRDQKAGMVGNIVDKECAVSMTEVRRFLNCADGRMTTRSWRSGTRSPTTGATPPRGSASRTRPLGSSPTTRCWLG